MEVQFDETITGRCRHMVQHGKQTRLCKKKAHYWVNDEDNTDENAYCLTHANMVAAVKKDEKDEEELPPPERDADGKLSIDISGFSALQNSVKKDDKEDEDEDEDDSYHDGMSYPPPHLRGGDWFADWADDHKEEDEDEDEDEEKDKDEKVENAQSLSNQNNIVTIMELLKKISINDKRTIWADLSLELAGM